MTRRELIRAVLIFLFWNTMTILSIALILCLLTGLISFPDWKILGTIFTTLTLGLIFVRK
jgi:hypothetical protein